MQPVPLEILRTLTRKVPVRKHQTRRVESGGEEEPECSDDHDEERQPPKEGNRA
jgi:hypothetical protein